MSDPNESSESETQEAQKKVTKEFRDKVIKWLSIDDELRTLRAKSKELTTEKKQNEEYILSYMEEIEEKCFNVKDGKLRRNVSKSKGPLKKTLIEKIEAKNKAVEAKKGKKK